MNKRDFLIWNILILFSLFSFSQIERIEPPNWWIGFKNNQLDLLVKGENISNYNIRLDYPGVTIKAINKADSKNYLFINLEIDKKTKPGKIDLIFVSEIGKEYNYKYKLDKIRSKEDQSIGFDISDVVYLITPDRFSNGDETNDSFQSLREKTIDRKDLYGRHGGDLRGIINSLDYLKTMGYTSLWLNPVLSNDMETYSYHGYSTTDYYRVDPRFGTNNEYIELANKASKKGIKLIKDIILNHCGLYHWWMDDLPFNDWINNQEIYENAESIEDLEKNIVYSNHRRTTHQDIYASDYDLEGMTDGWFVPSMPDLNQRNPFMAKYLIQNSLWWIETLNLSGIRQDTYPYPDKNFMSNWAKSIMNEYPKFNIVGEEWTYNPLLVAYWQDGSNNKDGYKSNLKSTMDFPMQKVIFEGISENENWNTGLIKIYEGLSNDFHYPDPKSLMVFMDNHDMSRVYTQFKKNIIQTKMALGLILIMPRIPQILYGTEILMHDTSKPGHHGLIRSDFAGGWKSDKINAFDQSGLSNQQIEMQDFLKKVLNFRKNNKIIINGETKHFAPKDGVYLLSRKYNEETILIIINKNSSSYKLDLKRFSELNLNGKTLKNIISEEIIEWNDDLILNNQGVVILTTTL